MHRNYTSLHQKSFRRQIAQAAVHCLSQTVPGSVAVLCCKYNVPNSEKQGDSIVLPFRLLKIKKSGINGKIRKQAYWVKVLEIQV